MKKFYYTFGSSVDFPFQNGWVVIHAENITKAHEIFRKHFPDRHENCLNCSFYYTEEKWNTINANSWKGYKCYGEYWETGIVHHAIMLCLVSKNWKMPKYVLTYGEGECDDLLDCVAEKTFKEYKQTQDDNDIQLLNYTWYGEVEVVGIEQK